MLTINKAVQVLILVIVSLVYTCHRDKIELTHDDVGQMLRILTREHPDNLLKQENGRDRRRNWRSEKRMIHTLGGA